MSPHRTHAPSRPAPPARSAASPLASRPFHVPPAGGPAPIQREPARGHEFGRLAVSDPAQGARDARSAGAAATGGPDVIQRLGWETLGRLNPRRYLPERLGGYTQQQMVENGLGEGAPLSHAELHQVANAPPYGHEDFGGAADEVPYGEDDAHFKSAACWNWALCGAGPHPVWPTYLFSALGDEGLDQPLDYHMPDAEHHGRAWYQAHRHDIEALRQQRREGAPAADVRRRATEMMVRANGMQVAQPEDHSPYSIAVESERNDDVDWTHWGVGVRNHTFETNPGVGMWHTTSTFEHNWANEHAADPADRRWVTTVPVRALRPEHNQHIRRMLGHELA